MYIKDLTVGTQFSLLGRPDVYSVTRPVRRGDRLTVVTYVHAGSAGNLEFEFARSSFTTVKVY
jgi:hypothetical protein